MHAVAVITAASTLAHSSFVGGRPQRWDAASPGLFRPGSSFEHQARLGIPELTAAAVRSPHSVEAATERERGQIQCGPLRLRRLVRVRGSS